MLVDGKCYLEALGERYVLDGGLITAISFYPSSMIGRFMEKVNSNVQNMFEALGYKNGVFFFQAIPDGDDIYVYEMGLRVSGGMIYNMTEAAGCNNAMKMLIYHSLTGRMCEPEDLKTIDPYFNGKMTCTLSLPLRLGIIAHIDGMDEVKAMPGVIDVTVYYGEGHECEPKHINTLDQLFGRVMVIGDDRQSLFHTIARIREVVKVTDCESRDMIEWKTIDRIIRNK